MDELRRCRCSVPADVESSQTQTCSFCGRSELEAESWRYHVPLAAELLGAVLWIADVTLAALAVMSLANGDVPLAAITGLVSLGLLLLLHREYQRRISNHLDLLANAEPSD